MISLTNKEIEFIDLGLTEYQKAWDYQTRLSERILSVKTQNRQRLAEDALPTPNFLIFCEHPHVFTLGKRGDEKNLVIPKEELHSIQATYHQINRGGDITYHGPGQLVVYPVLDLENFFTDIHRYMRLLEEVVIRTLAQFEIEGGRIQGLTGVWLEADRADKARKICALGVKTSRWVTLHGLALNINTDLNYFNFIIPCGISDKAVTSMQRELGHKLTMSHVAEVLKQKFIEVFEGVYL